MADRGLTTGRCSGRCWPWGRSSWCGSTGTGSLGRGFSGEGGFFPGPSLWEEVELRLGGRYQRVRLHFGWREVEVEGRRLHLVVCRVPALGRRGVVATDQLAGEGEGGGGAGGGGVPQAVGGGAVLPALEEGAGLETFQVRGLPGSGRWWRFCWGWRCSFGKLSGWGVRSRGFFAARGKLGLPSERDGPYLLLRGLVRLLNYEVTQELLKQAKGGEEGGFG